MSTWGTRTTLPVDLENTGQDDQDRVSIFVESSRLDIKESVYNLNIDTGDKSTKTFDLEIPANLTPGNYFIQVIANVNNNEETNREAATLTVRDCTPVTPPPADNPQNNQNKGTTEVKITEIPPTAGVIYGQQKPQTSFFDSPSFVIMLGGLFFIALVLVIILVAILVRK